MSSIALALRLLLSQKPNTVCSIALVLRLLLARKPNMVSSIALALRLLFTELTVLSVVAEVWWMQSA